MDDDTVVEPAGDVHKPPPLDADEMCVNGVLLLIAIKLIGIEWIGLDADAWYVWPWSWVAFGMMVPAIVEWVNDSRGA